MSYFPSDIKDNSKYDEMKKKELPKSPQYIFCVFGSEEYELMTWGEIQKQAETDFNKKFTQYSLGPVMVWAIPYDAKELWVVYNNDPYDTDFNVPYCEWERPKDSENYDYWRLTEKIPGTWEQCHEEDYYDDVE